MARSPYCSGPAKPNTVGWPRAVGALLLFSVACSGHDLLNEPPEKISAFVGDTAILPCSISVQGELPTVEWSKEGLQPNITFLYRDGCETFDMKNKAFRHRTNLIMSELKNGNISLMLSNLQLADAGKYQCMVVWGKNRKVVKTLELFVGAASEPKLSVVPGADSARTLECEAICWFPEPEVTFMDDREEIIRAENPKRNLDPRGCFNITKRVTVPTASNRVRCSVHEPVMNKTIVKDIYYIPGDCGCSCVMPYTGICVLVILVVCWILFFLKNQYCASTGPCRLPFTPCEAQPKRMIPQADPNQNEPDVTEDLQKPLCDKNEALRTPEVNRLKVRLQHGQPTIPRGPSTSPDTPKPANQSLQQPSEDGGAQPPASPSGHCATLSPRRPSKAKKRASRRAATAAATM